MATNQNQLQQLAKEIAQTACRTSASSSVIYEAERIFKRDMAKRLIEHQDAFEVLCDLQSAEEDACQSQEDYEDSLIDRYEEEPVAVDEIIRARVTMEESGQQFHRVRTITITLEEQCVDIARYPGAEGEYEPYYTFEYE